jgi:hypothetical protein
MATIVPYSDLPPSRDDPNNFSERADLLVAWLVNQLVPGANAVAAEVNDNAAAAYSSAATANTKAGEAAAARDIAMAAVNYKGLWSSLSGALNIPASAFHSGSIWILTQSVANVATETPGVSSKWLNVTPASGLGSAAYQSASAFQPALGAITALLKSTGGGNIVAASAADLVAAIGATAVQNATSATSATTAANATAIDNGAVSIAAKIANGIITWSKMVAMNSGRLIGRTTAGGGSPEEIGIGTGLALSGGSLSNSGVTAFNSRAGAVSLSSGDVTSALGYSPANSSHAHSYADLSAIVGAVYIGPNGGQPQYIRFTRANGGTFDIATFNG